MIILSLDLSTNTGYALIEYTKPKYRLITYGTLHVDQTPGLKYPLSFINRAELLAQKVLSVLNRAVAHKAFPDVIVIEETNIARSRYSQKLLEFIHLTVLNRLTKDMTLPRGITFDMIKYVNTSDWRRPLKVQLTAEDKKQNAKLSKAKSAAKKAGTKLDKKALGIRGRINKKHVAIRVVNSLFDLDFKPKDNDLADAICMGVAYTMGIKICDGK